MEEQKDAGNIGKGDVIKLDFELWLVNPGGKEELYDTTVEERAKENKIHDEKRTYEPMPLIVGHDRMVKGLDKALLGAKVGQDLEVVIPPAEGAGERKPELVELISVREFARDNKDEEPRIGMEVVRKGKRGTITGVAAGRIRIDFNNPLAGKTLKYKYKVVSKADALEDKVRGVIHMDYGMGDEFKLTMGANEVDIMMPEVCKYDPNWSIAKYKLVSDLRDIIGLGRVRLIEEYVKKEEAPEPKKEEGAPKEGEKTGEGGKEPKGEKEGHAHKHDDGKEHAHAHEDEHGRRHEHDDEKEHEHHHENEGEHEHHHGEGGEHGHHHKHDDEHGHHHD